MTSSNPFDEIDQRLQGIEDKLQSLVNKPESDPPTKVRFLTVEQVCEMLSISRVSLWNWDKKGITQPIRIGNLKRYRQSDIESLGNTRDEQSGASN